MAKAEGSAEAKVVDEWANDEALNGATPEDDPFENVYLVYNIQPGLKSKSDGRLFDLVEGIHKELVRGPGNRATTWFMDPGEAMRLFRHGAGCYKVDVIARGNGTKPVRALFMGHPVWPSGVRTLALP